MGVRRSAGCAVLMLAVLAVVGPAQAGAATFEVTSTADPGDGVCNPAECTLREAITAAGAAGADTIDFDIAGSGPHVIMVASALPDVPAETTIDGSSEPDFVSTPVVQIDGTLAPPPFTLGGLRLTGGTSTVKALAIARFPGKGIEITSSGNTVIGNHIGTDTIGTSARGGFFGVVTLSGTGNAIGGDTASERNVIAGNLNGVQLNSAGNTVSGNYIGLAVGGDAAVPNADGVIVAGSGNTIGGNTPGERNVISGNIQSGVVLSTASSSASTVRGNYIGLAADGAAALGNRTGVIVQGAVANTISANVISSNMHGVSVFTPSGDISIDANKIGLASDGVTARGNTESGIWLASSSGNSVTGNTIGFSGTDGVRVTEDLVDAGDANTISANSIRASGDLGIDLTDDGVTANDAPANLDADSGPNDLQNFPTLTSATVSGGAATVGVTLNSKAITQYRIELFRNQACNTLGNGEGGTFLGSQVVTTNGSGAASTPVAVGGVGLGDAVTATATDPAGNTSEFSACRTATAAPAALSATGVALSGIEGVALNGVTTATFSDTAALPASSYSATITWGDGSSSAGTVQAAGGGQYRVIGNHTFGNLGSYAVKTHVQSNDSRSANAQSTAKIANGKLVAEYSNRDYAVEGFSSTFFLASFSDENRLARRLDYTVTIHWGDGATSPGALVGDQYGRAGYWDVTSHHRYVRFGQYPVTIEVRDDDGDLLSMAAQASVSDGAFWVSDWNGGGAREDTRFSYTVFCIWDENPLGRPSDFSAQMKWDDGTKSSVPVVAGLSPAKSGCVNHPDFSVKAVHTYKRKGTYNPTLTVTSDGTVTPKSGPWKGFKVQ